MIWPIFRLVSVNENILFSDDSERNQKKGQHGMKREKKKIWSKTVNPKLDSECVLKCDIESYVVVVRVSLIVVCSPVVWRSWYVTLWNYVIWPLHSIQHTLTSIYKKASTWNRNGQTQIHHHASAWLVSAVRFIYLKTNKIPHHGQSTDAHTSTDLRSVQPQMTANNRNANTSTQEKRQ